MEHAKRTLCLVYLTSCFRRRRFLVVPFIALICTVWRGDAAAESWVRKGPESGTVWALAIDPANSAILYAGLDSGLFKSTDSGSHWTEINIGVTPIALRAVAIDLKNPTTTYVTFFVPRSHCHVCLGYKQRDAMFLFPRIIMAIENQTLGFTATACG